MNLVFLLCIYLSALLCGCATTDTVSNTQPSWWDNPQRHGEEFLYFKAMGESMISMEDARQKAMQSVRRQIVEYTLAHVSLSDGTSTHSRITDIIPLSEVQAMGHPDDAFIDGKWYVWILGRYPVAEYKRIRAQVDVGRELDQLRTAAASSLNRQDFDAAESQLLTIIDMYPDALAPSFPLESIKLDLANLYLQHGSNLRARQWVMDVKSGSTDATWQKRATDIALTIPPPNLKDAFEDKSLGILGLRGDTNGYKLDRDLTQSLYNRIGAEGARLKNIEISPQHAVTLVDQSYIGQMCATLPAEGFDALLIVTLTTDPSRIGRQQEIYGITKDVLDSQLNYWVARVQDGQILATGQTAGYARNIDAMVNVITSHRRHLPMHAPAIADAMRTD